MSTVSRATTKGHVSTLLSPYLTTALGVNGQLLQYQPKDLAGRSPVVTLLSASSLRERATAQGSRATFGFDLNLFVIRVADNWTEANAESKLDELELCVATFVDAKSPTQDGKWLALDYAGESVVALFKTQSGHVYLTERVPLAVAVML